MCARSNEIQPAEDARDAGRLLHWLLWLALLCLQFLLFHHYAEREVLWAYPRHCDQALYLRRAYETHQHIVRDGLWRGLAFGDGFNGGDPSPNGAVTHLQAALLFCLLGPSRMTALTLLFIYFAVFQAMWFSTLRAVSGRWTLAWIGMGLLLAARTTFQETGGIMDFRSDFPTLCQFGVFLCCAIRSNVFQRTGWSLACGAVAGLTLVLRFIAVAYFIPIFALTLLVLMVHRFRRRSRPDATPDDRLRNLFLAGALGSLLAGPVLWHHEHAIAGYYLRLHATGPDRYERAATYHVMDWASALTFYPKSMYLHHCGLVLVGLGVALIVAGALLPQEKRAPLIADVCNRRLAIAFSLISFLVPLAALNWDVDKNSSVGDIVVPPLLWLVMLLARFPTRNAVSSVTAHWRCAWPATCIAAGIASQVTACSKPSELSRERRQVMSVMAMYDAMWSTAARNGWTAPVIADDSTTEYQFPATIDVTIYERHGLLLHSEEALGKSLLYRSPEQIFVAVKAADFVLLSEPAGKNRQEDALTRSTEAIHPELLAWCRAHMALLYDCPAPERRIIVFARDSAASK